MAERIQARAIRRCGELLRQVEADKGGYHGNYAHDATDIRITRTQAAKEAGLSERQKVTALRVASIPQPVFEQAIAQEEPPTVTQLAEQGKQSKPEPLHDLEGIDPYLYARAIRRCGELLKQIEPKQGANQNIRDGADMKVLTRTQAAKDAGLSERQKVTASIPQRPARIECLLSCGYRLGVPPRVRNLHRERRDYFPLNR